MDKQKHVVHSHKGTLHHPKPQLILNESKREIWPTRIWYELPGNWHIPNLRNSHHVSGDSDISDILNCDMFLSIQGRIVHDSPNIWGVTFAVAVANPKSWFIDGKAIYNFMLVVCIPTPLKNMKSVGMIIFPMIIWKKCSKPPISWLWTQKWVKSTGKANQKKSGNPREPLTILSLTWKAEIAEIARCHCWPSHHIGPIGWLGMI